MWATRFAKAQVAVQLAQLRDYAAMQGQGQQGHADTCNGALTILDVHRRRQAGWPVGDP